MGQGEGQGQTVPQLFAAKLTWHERAASSTAFHRSPPNPSTSPAAAPLLWLALLSASCSSCCRYRAAYTASGRDVNVTACDKGKARKSKDPSHGLQGRSFPHRTVSTASGREPQLPRMAGVADLEQVCSSC